MNLNDTSSRGPLTADELKPYWPMPGVDIDAVHRKVGYIPKGCDAQGRYPQAAEAATEIGVEEDALCCAKGLVYGTAIGLALWAVIAAVVLLLKGA